MKNSYIYLLVLVTASLLCLPLSETHAQGMPGGGSTNPIAFPSTAAINTPITISAPTDCYYCRWFSGTDQIGVGPSIVVSQSSAGTYNYWYLEVGETYDPYDYLRKQVDVEVTNSSPSTKAPTPALTLNAAAKSITATGCSGTVVWMSGSHIMGTGNYIEFNSTTSSEYKAYCEEPGKSASDPASQSLGNSLTNRTSPVIRAMYTKGTHSDGYEVFNRQYDYSAGKTVYLEQGNCYGAISWLKNGVEFSTDLMPQTTLNNACDVYELKCTYSDGVQISGDLFYNSPITITQQPTSQTVLGGTGASVTLSVRAKNVTTYQWRRNGVEIPEGSRGGGLSSTDQDFYIYAVNSTEAGSYDVVLKGNNSCVATVTSNVAVLTVIAGANLTMSNTPVTCNGGNDGTATVTASGGTPPYTYLWSNGQTTSTITGLTSGTYTVTVKDATGTATNSNTFVSAPSPISFNRSIANVSCNGGNNGSATVTVVNGTPNPPFTYSWTGAGITGNSNTSVTGLSAGSYTLNVQDSKGCQGSTVVTITEPTAITLNPSKNNISCNGVSDGSIIIGVSGGKTPYTYAWSNGITSTTNSASGLGPGTYTVTVKDANNCTKSISVDIIEPAGMTLTPSSTPAKCKGGNDGTATVSVSGGTSPYTYSWSGGITSTTNTATGLTAGSYTVTVKDVNNCPKSITITVGEPATLLTVTIPPPTNATCNGANDGIATGNVSGGNTPYTYLWSNGNTNLTANNLPAGSNTLQVTDANGCIKTQSVSISEPAAIVLVPNSTPVKCKGGNNGVASVSASGGAGGYSYSWSGGITSSTNTATGLTKGTYTVTVKDANNCTKSIAIEVTEPDELSLTPNQTNISCNGVLDGAASVTVTGGTAAYSYSWNNGITSTTNAALGLGPGTYTVTVKDANNCQKSETFTFLSPDAITLTPSSTPAKCKNGNDGTATVNASGGAGGYTYAWSGGITSTTNTATGLTAGSYTVTVKDANNCSKSIAITVGEPTTLLTVTIPPPTNITCNGANDGIATGNISGGNTPYTYLWSNGNTNLTANNLPAGTNTLQVTDGNGCIKTQSVSISQPAAIVLVPSNTPVKCKGGNDGVASVSASGGAGGYSYSWSGGITSSTNTATGLIKGTYTVTVKDANNCTNSIAIEITEPDALSLIPSSTPVNCNGGNDGTASVAVSGGVTAYTYSWSGGITSTSNSATGLVAGTYTVTVKDANNCTKSISITVTEPAAIVLVPSSTPAKCKNGNDGTASVSASGGTGGYTYSWSGGITSTTNTATGLTAGSYTVTVKDANNCSKSIAITVGEPATLLTVNIPPPTNISCNGANDGIATGNVSGGNTPYTYLWSNGNTNLTANNLPAGTNTLQVTDGNGCIKTQSVSISEPAAIVLVPSNTPIKCKGGNDGVANVSASGGAGGYSYSWSGGISSSTNTATGLVAGTYTVTVKDANNCTKSISITVNEPDALTLTPSSTPVKCNGSNDGTASVSVSGGKAPYTYSWSGGLTSTSNSVTNLAAGNYTVTVTDANNCQKSTTINITEAAVITLTPSSTGVKCKGGNDGTATVNVSGGAAPYTYSWSGGITSTTNTATGLVAGNYTVTVKDVNNCQKSLTITVVEPATVLTLSPSSTAVKCKGGNDGTATVNVSGGISPYTYSWGGGVIITNTVTGLTAGGYTVTVKDANNCQRNLTVVVTEPPALTLTPSSTAVKCNGGNDGTASVSVTGGTGTYTYSWSGGITSTTNTATGLTAGTYTVTVKDANNCQKSIDITVAEPGIISLTPNSTAVKCKGGNDGTATVSASGGTAPYRYSWSGGITSTTNTATGLTAGTYTVTVKDANNCQKSITITVAEPDLIALTSSSTLVKCKGGNDGTATVNVSGGTTPYTYSWSGGITSNTNTATGLAAGTYTVTVKDANNCQKSLSITVSEPATLLSLTSSSTAVKCKGGADGTITVNANGGAAPYTYSWSGGITSTTNTATGLTAGSYTVTVKDANNCEKNLTITVTEPTAIVLTPSTTAVKCNGGNDGTATVSVTGGTGAYTYSWSGGITSTTNTATGLAAGTYTVTVKDANNCQKSIDVTVAEPATLSLTPNSTAVKCKGGNDGTATVNASGGVAPYTYSWGGGITSTTNTATGLAAGSYAVTVKDANNCQKNITITVAEPDLIVLTSSSTLVKCKGGNDGTATVNVSGGIAPYTYSWSGGITSTTNTATGLAAGTYTVTVKDANNCQKSLSITVSEPATLLSLTSSSTAVKCKGGNDGTATVNASGGVAPYTYSWSGGIISATNTATGLTAGSYTVTVKDANNCEKNLTITVTEPTAIVLTPSTTAVKCNGGNDGTATVSVTGGTGAYTYSWRGGITSTTNTATGLAAGTYTVTVKDANNCQKSIDVTVAEPAMLSLTPNSTAVKCKGGNDGTATVNASGGVAPYTYSWGGGITSTTNTATGLVAGTYTVTVKDANNCQKNITITVAEPDLIALNSSNTLVKCKGGNDGTATVNVSGGTAPYTYSWSGGITSTTNTATSLTAGTYTVTVKDANNCQKSLSITVSEPDVLVLVPSSIAVKCSGDGTAMVSVSGGVSPYNYSWDKGVTSTTNVATGLPAGTYTVTVKDANNCEKSVKITIDQPASIILTPSIVSVKCNGGSDGAASVSVNGGVSPFTYSWSNGITSTTNQAINLAAGTYTVTVKDAANCEKNVAVTITEPDALTLTPNSTATKCKGSGDGIASVTVSGGTAPYTYSWSNGITSKTNQATGLPAGNYTVTVKDANNCEKGIVVTVTEPTELSLTPSSTPAKCKAGNDGIASVSVSGGTAPYTYAWSSGITSTTNTASNLTAGSYTVTVKDANGCEKSTTVIISEPAFALTLSSTTTAVRCSGGSDGTAIVSVTGGTGAYTYSWSGGITSTTNTATALKAGDYTVTVKDANNCEKSLKITITEPTGITLTSTSVPVKCFNGSDGSASVNVSGGTSPYEYSWNNGITSTINQATGLKAGDYTVTIKDANNCQKSIVISISQPTSMTLTPNSTAVKCKGSSDGTASVSVTGGTAPYTYSWSGGITSVTNTATGLAAGAYTVTVKDANNCQQSVVITVTEPAALTFTSTTTAVKCKGGSDGTASISVTGGTGAYTYSWSGVASTTNTATALKAGNYTVTVKDANNCEKSLKITITEPEVLTLVASNTPANCAGSTDGTASVAVSGGTTPYTYAWSGGITSTTNTAKGLAAGTYTVTVKDANNCQQTATITITEPEAATRMVLTPEITPAKCFGGIGSATVAVTGGISPYTYLWSNGVTTSELTNATAGEYTVTVKDAKGCSTVKAVNITSPTEIIIKPTIVNVKCNPQATGRILVEVSGGTAPYSYKWSTGSSNFFITDLKAGFYSVTITDKQNCSKTMEFEITQPAEPLQHAYITVGSVTCKGKADGFASTMGIGGTAPYTYLWSTNSTEPFIENLSGGNYSVKITDANNCILDSQIVVNEPKELILTAKITPPLCKGLNGTIMVTADDGDTESPLYGYSWNGGPFVPNNSSIIGPVGTYTVEVKKYYKECPSKVETFVIEEAVQELALTLDIVPEKCFNAKNGIATVIPTGGVAPYQYQWSTGATSFQDTKYRNGDISVKVTDKNGCIKQVSGTSLGPDSLTIKTQVTDVLCFNKKEGKIVPLVEGGTSPYEVSLLSLEKTGGLPFNDYLKIGTLSLKTNFTGLLSGNYALSVVDKNGCTVEVRTNVNQPASAVSVSLIKAVSPRGFGIPDGQLSFAIRGGTAPTGSYTTSWKVDGATMESTTNIVEGTQFITKSTAAVGGNYIITATDDNGCKVDFPYVLAQPEKLEANWNVKNPTCAGKVDGELTAFIGGGVSLGILLPYDEQYKTKWFRKENGVLTDLNVSKPTISNIEAGIYVIKATDKNDVSAEFEIELKPTPSIYASPTTIEPRCPKTPTGSIELANFSGGTAPYTVTWNKGLKGSKLTNLESGSYFAVIKDSKGCFGEVAVRLAPRVDYRVDLLTKTEPICKGECTGALAVVVKNNFNGLTTSSFEAQWSLDNGIRRNMKRVIDVATASNLCPGIYKIEVALAGCPFEKSFEIKNPDKSFAIEVSNDLTLCKSEGVVLNATQPEGASYLWTLPDGKALSTPVVPVEKSGIYKVEVTNTFGCKASDAFNINVLNIETTADFAVATTGYVGLRQVVAPLLVEKKNYKWRLSDGLLYERTDFEGKITIIPQRVGEFYIDMIVEEDVCEAVISKKLVVRQPPNGKLAVNESVVNLSKMDDEKATFIVYPNPSTGRFVIEPRNHALTDILEFNVFDAGTGRLLYSNKGVNNGQNSFEVNIEEQPQGIVTVVMDKNGKKVAKKVIIQK